MTDRTAARPRKRRSGFLEIANGLLTLLVLGLVVASGLFFFGVYRFNAPGGVAEEKTFLVEPGSGLRLTAERLESQGLIENSMLFQFGGWALKKQGQLKAGVFRIPAGASMADILEELTEGTPVPFRVTVPEGLTAWEVVKRVNEDEQLVGEIAAVPPEGSILPQSYDYLPGADRQEILDKMQAAMKEQVAQIWANRDPDLPIGTPEEMVILASIVEKETGVPEERGQVASVFINRLREGMRLQSDPTIIYGITKGQETLGRGLRRSEIDQETPYNTYQIDGLPPTPIANPGVEALKAVANPPETDYLYFVAKGAVPSEGHVFAATYEEHQRNVAKWRAIEAEQAAAAEAEGAPSEPAQPAAQ
jgi:UPF0755 protein